MIIGLSSICRLSHKRVSPLIIMVIMTGLTMQTCYVQNNIGWVCIYKSHCWIPIWQASGKYCNNVIREVLKKTVFLRSGSVHTKLLCNATKIMMTIARRGKRNNWITQKYNLLSLTWFNPIVYNNLTYFLKRNFAGTNQKLVILLLYESYIKLIIVESNTDLLERVSFWRFWRGSPYHVFPHPKFS